MLVAATAVFVYYTIWTLLMVHCTPSSASYRHCLTLLTAFRRRLPSLTITLPSSSLGHPDTSHSHPSRWSGRGKLLIRRDDQKQQEEGIEGAKGKGRRQGAMNDESVRMMLDIQAVGVGAMASRCLAFTEFT